MSKEMLAAGLTAAAAAIAASPAARRKIRDAGSMPPIAHRKRPTA